jgi:adenine-specific DNA-methyltransferase
MKPRRQEMIDRCDQGKYFWELRSCAYWETFDQPKIIYPDIYEHQSFAWDEQGFYGTNTCYFIPTDEQWLIAILNSQVIEWFYSQISNKIRGGYMRAFSDYMRTVPIPKPAGRQQQLIERLSEYLIYLNSLGAAEGQSAMAAYFERLLNGLVYELFFESDLHAQKLMFFACLDMAKPPRLDSIPKSQRTARLAEFHAQIANLNHPLYASLFSLNGLEVVRIIEGKT